MEDLVFKDNKLKSHRPSAPPNDTDPSKLSILNSSKTHHNQNTTINEPGKKSQNSPSPLVSHQKI
jgi:hypothetical protein